jgi:hypothetical protein
MKRVLGVVVGGQVVTLAAVAAGRVVPRGYSRLVVKSEGRHDARGRGAEHSGTALR